MVPDNPSNSNPFIFRILDSLGISHQNAPVNHTHAQSEVNGLESALAGKANASHTHDVNDVNNLGSILSSLESSIGNKISKVTSPIVGNFPKFKGDGTIEDSGYSASSFADVSSIASALAGKQDTLTFDSTPTASSTNPVTSGGVKTALDAKAPKSVGEVWGDEFSQSIDLESIFQDGREMQTFAILAGQNSFDLDEVFTTPSSGSIVYPQGSTPTIQSSHFAAIRVLKTKDPGNSIVYLVILDGIFDYSA